VTDGFRVAAKVGRASREDDSERPGVRRLFFPSQVYFRTSFGRYQSGCRESGLGEALREGERPFKKGAQFLGTINDVRAVHAEMAAISDAARHG